MLRGFPQVATQARVKMARNCANSDRTVLSHLTLTAGDKGIKCPSGSPEQCRGGPLGAPPLATGATLPTSHATRAPGCAAPRPVPLGKLQSDAWAGGLGRRPEAVVCRGKWLAAVVVLPHLKACRSSGLAGVRGTPRRAFLGVPWFGRPGELLPPGPWCFGLVVPASSSCRDLVALARQAPLAGPRLLGPASSSCRGLVF